jgi:hypothetical protein
MHLITISVEDKPKDWKKKKEKYQDCANQIAAKKKKESNKLIETPKSPNPISLSHMADHFAKQNSSID